MKIIRHVDQIDDLIRALDIEIDVNEGWELADITYAVDETVGKGFIEDFSWARFQAERRHATPPTASEYLKSYREHSSAA